VWFALKQQHVLPGEPRLRFPDHSGVDQEFGSERRSSLWAIVFWKADFFGNRQRREQTHALKMTGLPRRQGTMRRITPIHAWREVNNLNTHGRVANPTVSARTATEWAVGLNWYLNSFIKWQVDYARTFFDKGAVFGDRPDESVFETQLQIAF